MNKKKSVLVLLVILLVCLFLNPASGSAYVLNKQRMRLSGTTQEVKLR